MPRRPALVLATALAILTSAAPGARAQTVTGLGADALIVPEGAVRLSVRPAWSRWLVRVDPASLRGAPSGTPIAEQLRIERSVLAATLAAEVGVTNWLSLEVSVPVVRSRVESNFNLLLLAPDAGEGTEVTLVRSGVGDVEAGARLQLFSTLPRARRLAPPGGLHVRGAAAAVARVGTGMRALLGDSMEIGTGDEQSDLEVRSEWDLILGPRLWATAVARYGWQLPRQQESPGRTTNPPEVVDRDLGDYLEVEVIPRLSLGRFFGIGGRYVYRSKAEDRMTPAGADAPEQPAPGVRERESRIYGGVAYSSIAGFRARQARVPIDVSLQYGRTIGSAPRGRQPVREVVFQARVYTRLFGRGTIR